MARERTWTIAVLTVVVVVVLGYRLRYEPATGVPLLLPLLLGGALAAAAASQRKFTALEACLPLVGAGWALGFAIVIVAWTNARIDALAGEAFSLSLGAEAGGWLGATWACWMGVVACVRSPTRRSFVLRTAAMILGGVAGTSALLWLSATDLDTPLPRVPLASGFAIGLACMVLALTWRERDRARRGLGWLLSGLAIALAAMLDGFLTRLSPVCFPSEVHDVHLVRVHLDSLTSRTFISLGAALAAGAFVFMSAAFGWVDLDVDLAREHNNVRPDTPFGEVLEHLRP